MVMELQQEERPQDSIDLRRSYTMPSRSVSAEIVALRHSKSDTIGHKVDCFGFILNMDSQGNLHDDDYEEERIQTFAEMKRNERRTLKWQIMMASWISFRKRRPRKVLTRCRKGIPHAQRGRVWALLGGIDAKMKQNPGLYHKLVRQALGGPTVVDVSPDTNKSFRNIQDTIERDIHRTYPRHAMFYDRVRDDNDSMSDEGKSPGFCGTVEISNMLRDLGEHPDDVAPERVLDSTGGQASLRRVLKAYSMYDSDIGYCQGMNFIAGMFLTLMSEEKAFWLLVAIMNEKPCRMRGLFGEGMRETHQVLYVAEKLIHQFLPRLARHMDKENIHVTMFATQWLLTQYTSSFRFDLVTRVWDCFLAEGWKITYRVMLAMLQQWQPALLKMQFEEILAFFRELPDRVEGGPTVDAAVKIPLRRRHIAKYEKEWRDKQQHQEQNGH